MMVHMRHMGNSGRIAIGAFLAALALLVLTGVTLHETVALWFLAASVAAYVACVSEVVVRRRHKTLIASGIGSVLFIAFGIAFLRQWGLAFNADPDALSAPVDAEHPDLYFYLAAAAGALTLLLLFAGTVLPGKRRHTASAPRRRPAPASRATTRTASSRTASSRTAANRTSANRSPAPRGSAPRATPAAKAQSARVPAPRAASSAVKRPASSAVKRPALSAGGASASKAPAKSPARPSAPAPSRR
jgi:hypothetical protein